jgi:hypothetical protein
VRCFRGAQAPWAGSPAPRCSDHGRSSLVQTRDRPGYGSAVIGVELYDHSNGKPSKLSETPGGTQKLKAFDDAPVQFDQFVFEQLRDVWEQRGAQYTTRVQALSSAARPMTIGLIPSHTTGDGGDDKATARIGIVCSSRPWRHTAAIFVGIVQGTRSTYACSSRISVT